MSDQNQASVAAQAIFEGVVSRFFVEKHFGFLRYPAGELFFHEFDVTAAQALPRGTRVRFSVGTYKDRPVALNVTPLTPVPARATSDEGAE